MANERQTVDGRNATVCYFTANGSEADRSSAVRVRIYFDDNPNVAEECAFTTLLTRMGIVTFEPTNEDWRPTLPLFGNHEWRPPI